MIIRAIVPAGIASSDGTVVVVFAKTESKESFNLTFCIL